VNIICSLLEKRSADGDDYFLPPDIGGSRS